MTIVPGQHDHFHDHPVNAAFKRIQPAALPRHILALTAVAVDWDGTDSIRAMVKPRATKQKRHVRVLLLAVVGSIVFGILGMHSLAQNHTTSAATAQSVAATQLMPTGSMPADMVDGHNRHGKDPSGPDDHCEMLVLCVTAIVGGALLLWAEFVALRRRPMALLKRTSTTVRTCVRSICRPPPDLISLSILRC